jgi:hypothetical protein
MLKIRKAECGAFSAAMNPQRTLTTFTSAICPKMYAEEVLAWKVVFSRIDLHFFVYMRDEGDWRFFEPRSGVLVGGTGHKTKLAAILKGMERLNAFLSRRGLPALKAIIARYPPVASMPQDAETKQYGKHDDDEPIKDIKSVKQLSFK